MTSLGWVPRLPDHWDVVPLNFVAKMGTGHTPDRSKPEYWENCTIPWVTTTDATRRPDSLLPLSETDQKISELGLARSAAVLHRPGTVMLSRTASVGYSVIIDRPMATTQAFVTWHAGPRLDPRYLLLLLRAMRPEWDRLAYGSTHRTIYLPDLESLCIPLPPIGEQRRIASFLDVEAARIESVICARADARQLLYERRAAEVFRAISGSDFEERRASGLPWVREIPTHWRSVKLSHVARMGSGHTPSRARPEWWTDCTIPWVTTGEVSQMRSDRLEFLESTREKISQIGLENSSAEVHPAGTVVLCRTAASAGYSAIMGADMATSQDIATWTCGSRLKPAYLLWCLRAMRTDLLERLAMGSTHKTIYMPDLQGLRVPLPSLDEQERIVADIRRSNEIVDSLIDALDRQIVLLAERRQALITAAVTGQIDVSTARGVTV